MNLIMTERIRGKVARVLNSREIAITVGSKHGVKVGMYFDVMDSKGESITDPDTGEMLGSIERPKVRVRVTNAQERLAVASTFRRKRVNVGGFGLNVGEVSRALMPPKWVTKYETLRTDEQTWEDLDPEESYVKVGDPVVQVVGDELEEDDSEN